jgi:acyl carrier protein
MAFLSPFWLKIKANVPFGDKPCKGRNKSCTKKISCILLFSFKSVFFAVVFTKLQFKMSAIATKVTKIIVEKLGVDESEVTPEASFTNDLGADSLDTVELIMEFEKEFNVSIPDDQAENIQTVGQAITYLEENSK